LSTVPGALDPNPFSVGSFWVPPASPNSGVFIPKTSPRSAARNSAGFLARSPDFPPPQRPSPPRWRLCLPSGPRAPGPSTSTASLPVPKTPSAPAAEIWLDSIAQSHFSARLGTPFGRGGGNVHRRTFWFQGTRLQEPRSSRPSSSRPARLPPERTREKDISFDMLVLQAMNVEALPSWC
jgi:hypothetical protein